MAIIQTGWRQYRQATGKVSKEELRNIKRNFYGGAFSLVGILQELVDEDGSIDVCILSAVAEEAINFAEEEALDQLTDDVIH